MLSISELTESEMSVVVGGTPPTTADGYQYYCRETSATGVAELWEIVRVNVNTGEKALYFAKECGDGKPSGLLTHDEVKAAVGPDQNSTQLYRSLDQIINDVEKDSNAVNDANLEKNMNDALKLAPAAIVDFGPNGGGGGGDGPGRYNPGTGSLGDGHGNTYTPSPGSGGGKTGVVEISD